MTAPARAPRTSTAVRRQQRSVGRTTTIRAALVHAGIAVRAVHTTRQPDGRTVTTVQPDIPSHLPHLAAVARGVAATHRWIEHVETCTQPAHVRLHGGPPRRGPVRTAHPIGDLL